MGDCQPVGEVPDVAITLTPAARTRVEAWLAGQPPGTAFRLGVRKTGCSGLAYVVGYGTAGPGDVSFDAGGIAVLVERESLPLIDGTEVDYVRQGLNAAFRFRNPQARGECGCGESFTV
jgi:iron-sulfur cluster assembly protein